MKKLLALLCVALALTVLLSSCGGAKSDENAPKGMIKASNDNVDYVKYVPEAWKVDKSNVYTSAFVSSSDPTNVSATVFSAEKGTEVEDWWKGFYEDFKTLYSDVGEAKTEKAKLGKADATKYSFKGTLNEIEYSYIIVATMKGSTIYYVTYTSVGDAFDAHLEELDTILSNFAFEK